MGENEEENGAREEDWCGVKKGYVYPRALYWPGTFSSAPPGSGRAVPSGPDLFAARIPDW